MAEMQLIEPSIKQLLNFPGAKAKNGKKYNERIKKNIPLPTAIKKKNVLLYILLTALA